MLHISRNRGLLLAASAALIVAGLAWWLWPRAGEAPRSRTYKDFDVCLLTDGKGLSGPQAAPVWAGLGDVSAARQVRISALAADDEDPRSPGVSANTLAGRHCGVIVAVGAPQVSAVKQIAGRYTEIRFVLVGSGEAGRNLIWVSPDGDPRSSVRAAVEPLVP